MPSYRGRFAPTPSGPLHFGSLVAAVGSFLDARANAGRWLLRIEDLDTPRNVPGATDQILRQLEACALQWDEAPVYQSARIEYYDAALAQLEQRGTVFRCACSRKEIADSSLRGIDGPIYPGTCRTRQLTAQAARTWRARVDDAVIAFNDLLQGAQQQNLTREVGDFVVRRADGTYAYQLAVVVDDAAQSITRVVRGADLLLSTARQLHLQRALALSTPEYLHLPVALNAQGEKLSKQTHASAISVHDVSAAVAAALHFLNHAPPADLLGAPPAMLLAWATQAWDISRLPRQNGLPARA